MAAAGITKRWVRGSLLITVLVILAAEVMFLYTDYRELYGSVQRAAESRFSTIAGRLQATGTAGDANETSESRGQALRRTVEQFDEKDKFEFMLLDAQGVILATSSGTMTRDLTDGTDFLSAQTSASGKGHDIFTTPQGQRGNGHGCVQSGALCGRGRGCHAPCHQPDAGGPPVVEHRYRRHRRGCAGAGVHDLERAVFCALHRAAAGGN